MAAQTEFNAIGLGINPILSNVEGAFGLGFTLGTNLTLDVQTSIGAQVARNTPYALSYTDPADGTGKTISILHDPSLPFQAALPENTLLTLTVPASALYQALTVTLTIAPNSTPVWRVRLLYTEAYARLTVKRYF